MPLPNADRRESARPREGFSLADRVAAGATNQEVAREVRQDGTLERVQLRIYPGAQLDLQLVPVRRTSGQGGSRDYPLVDLVGKDHVDGDDDVWEWNVSRAIQEGEKIVVKATNQDANNSYDYRANFDVDYEGGLGRSLRSAVGEVLG